MKYLAVLGRQPQISLAELESLFQNVQPLGTHLATFTSTTPPDINRLGGSLKLAQKLSVAPLDYLQQLAPGKITLGVSDYSKNATRHSASFEAMKLKKQLARLGRSVRTLPNQAAVISTAAAHHNQLGSKLNHVELLKAGGNYYASIGVQNITAYTQRDQARPARDAKVGMLPPKLAQILINLCGPLPADSVVLDPFCGTGVVLQEAYLMGYRPYGTDLNARMVDYSTKNLIWLIQDDALQHHNPDALQHHNHDTLQYHNPDTLQYHNPDALHGHATDDNSSTSPTSNLASQFTIHQGDATSTIWQQPIHAVACEVYLGPPMSQPPAQVKLTMAQEECRTIIRGFLKNLAPQLASGTPVTLAIPAWLRPDGSYARLNLLDEIINLGYNLNKYQTLGQSDLLYFREGQIVAREIISLRKS